MKSPINQITIWMTATAPCATSATPAHSLTVSPLQFFVEAIRLVTSQMTIKALKISTTQLIFRQCGLILM
jgi:hypothetical protein